MSTKDQSILYTIIIVIGLITTALFMREYKSFYTPHVYKTIVTRAEISKYSVNYTFANGVTTHLNEIYPVDTKIEYNFCYRSSKWRWEDEFPKKTTGYWCNYKKTN